MCNALKIGRRLFFLFAVTAVFVMHVAMGAVRPMFVVMIVIMIATGSVNVMIIMVPVVAVRAVDMALMRRAHHESRRAAPGPHRQGCGTSEHFLNPVDHVLFPYNLNPLGFCLMASTAWKIS